MSEAVAYAVDADGVCTLTLDLPGKSMNVLNLALQSGLRAGIERALDDEAVRGIIITSGKPAFVAGADLKGMGGGYDFSALSDAQLLEQTLSLSMDLRRLETGGKPVVCALNGTALGGGFEIALACHYRVVADDPAIMLGLPEANVGLMPAAGGTQRLLRLIGIRAALPLLLQGRRLNPAAALKAKLVHEVVAREKLIETAREWLLNRCDAVAPWDKKGFKVPGGAGSLNAELNGFFLFNNAMIRAQSFGNLPAPEAISAAVFEGAQLPMDTALRLEAKYMVKLMRGSVSGALIRTLFLNKEKADKLESRPEGVEKVTYRKIGILGAGTMGAGLALHAATVGLEVVLLDRDQASAEKGKAYAMKRLGRDVEKGRKTQEKADKILARIYPTDLYADLADVQAVIEAVFEEREIKAAVIGKAMAVIPEHVIFASNTSAMPISGLAEFSVRPQKFIGMHFFSPAERMPLVEIIRGKQTADETLVSALDLAQAMRKTPIVVNDSPGFFTSRFIGAFVSESLRMVEEGVLPALVENAARMVGMPMGALAISDSIGLELSYNAGLQQARDHGVRTPPLGIIGKLVVEHQRLGLKSGKGFYDYEADGGKRLWPGLEKIYPPQAVQPSIEEVKTRILYAQLAEGARCFAEGVLVSVIDGDLGATLGVGFPTYLGGPFSAIDTLGVARVVAECDRLASLYGKPFEVPQLFRDMAAHNQTFYGLKAVLSPGGHNLAPPR